MINENASTATEVRALELLGSGVSAADVARALAVTPGRISQLLANTEFAAAVIQLKFDALQEHGARDSKYDNLEDKLLEKLERVLPMMLKPKDILNALKAVNAAKRRGVAATEHVVSQQNVVALVLPTIVAQTFTTNINNQVIKVGDVDLLTLSSNSLLEQVKSNATPAQPASIEAEGDSSDILSTL